MKIELDIPDDCVEQLKERNIRIFAGIDLIAEKLRGDRWKIKISSCSMCGDCCKNFKGPHPFPIINNQCIYLVNPPGYGNKWICDLKINRPFSCGCYNPKFKHCTVKYKYIGDKK